MTNEMGERQFCGKSSQNKIIALTKWKSARRILM